MKRGKNMYNQNPPPNQYSQYGQQQPMTSSQGIYSQQQPMTNSQGMANSQGNFNQQKDQPKVFHQQFLNRVYPHNIEAY